MKATAEVVNIEHGFASFTEHWSPRVAGDINNFQIKLVKLQGDFVWHSHAVEDELFLVTKGTMQMKLRDPEERTALVQLENSSSFLQELSTAHALMTRLNAFC